ncbi:MAG: hypothetical protein RIF33_04955 [Cyclobacteriaceae bacterium]
MESSAENITTATPQETDLFYQAIDGFSNQFAQYNPSSDQLVDTLDDYSEHWFLMSLEKHRLRLQQVEGSSSVDQLAKLPTPAELDMIKSIRQSAFYLSYPEHSDVVFEEWNFDDLKHAERWLVLLRDSLSRNDYSKPPRFQWTEGSHLYLVSTKSATQWSELGDTLVSGLSGHTKSQLTRLYDPIDLRHFKKWQGPANSTVIKTQQHLFQENLGPHYSYFYFVKQRLSGYARAQSREEFPSRTDFNITTSLHHPFTGQEQFDSIKETLVGIQCKIEEPALNSLDIVGKALPELMERFGEILYTQDDIIIFGYSNRIVITEMKSDMVRAFKYQRLKEPFSALKSNEDIRTAIVTFE